MAALQLGRQRDRAVVPPGGDHRIEKAAVHSTRSTKTSILPPQANPTSQACSLVTPKSSMRGLPSRIVSSASVTPAPSTQPPDTEPIKAPSLSTASLEPSGRGEEPQVLTTVASATPLPASRQRAACSRISAVSLMSPLTVIRHSRESGNPEILCSVACPGPPLAPQHSSLRP